MSDDHWTLRDEIAKQDRVYGSTFGGGSELASVRLGIAVLDDEVQETLNAWVVERKLPYWSETRDEALQVAAVAMRLVRLIDSFDSPSSVPAVPQSGETQ